MKWVRRYAVKAAETACIVMLMISVQGCGAVSDVLSRRGQKRESQRVL